MVYREYKCQNCTVEQDLVYPEMGNNPSKGCGMCFFLARKFNFGGIICLVWNPFKQSCMHKKKSKNGHGQSANPTTTIISEPAPLAGTAGQNMHFTYRLIRVKIEAKFVETSRMMKPRGARNMTADFTGLDMVVPPIHVIVSKVDLNKNTHLNSGIFPCCVCPC